MAASPQIPERFIRHIWQHQLFNSADLRTPDGRPVAILSPGSPNHDAGPDFKGARIRINHITYLGDVELHRDAASWTSHSHNVDPHYNRVILHVVMTADPLLPAACTVSRRAIPLLVLHPYLDPALRTEWETMFLGPESTGRRTLPCSQFSRSVAPDIIATWLDRLAAQRLEMKIRRFQERLQQLADEQSCTVREPFPRYYGDPAELPLPQKEYVPRDFASRELWEQLLYEAVMECLGFAKNRKPFQELARSMTLERLKRYRLEDTETMMAMLFGAAGLLPSSRRLPEKTSRIYVRRLRRRWKELRPLFRIPVLHEADWLFFRLRPGNFPTARLAAWCYVLPRLFGGDGFRRIIGIFAGDERTASAKRKELRALFAFRPDSYWHSHYHFGGCTGRWGASLGKDRVHEILVNALLPIVLLYGRIFRKPAIQQRAKELLTSLPPSPPNSITLLVTREVLHDRLPLRSAFLQQGALQLHNFYCTQRGCGECAIGKAM